MSIEKENVGGTVMRRSTRESVTIYGVSREGEETKFLVFMRHGDEGKWVWDSAENYIPYGE